MVSLIGQGYYGTHLPPVIQRNVLENPAWYTAYTPYQAEISQGRLEALLNFQTMIADLTGLEIANASLLDEATAAAEAMAMARRVAQSQANAFFVDRDCHPQTMAVMRTRAEPLGWSIIVGDPADRSRSGGECSARSCNIPARPARIRDSSRRRCSALHAAGALAVVAADPLALALLMPPGELGADIAIGSTQRFGVPMGYGGPHAAYIATKSALQRALPGRIVGVSVDSRGRPAYRLALQTREQHIRREKATSNICTAQVLLAVIASMYGVYHGADGLAADRRARGAHGRDLGRRACRTAAGPFCDPPISSTRSRSMAGAQQQAIFERALAAASICGGSDRNLAISCDETTTPEIVERVWGAFGRKASPADEQHRSFAARRRARSSGDPGALRRTSTFMTHPVFVEHRSETEMLRYLRRLADRDLALDRTMIPSGSCTMKLNATAEMMPLTWPGFADVHPFAPDDQAQGYAEMIADLEAKLVAISGYDAVSLQPNSGAQGEYAGLLAIRAYHRARGDVQRTVCLIPTSAHGTNPASAHMAGMDVVPVGCDAHGNVDLDRSSRQGGEVRRPAGCDHDHLSVDARRIRDLDPVHLRDLAVQNPKVLDGAIEDLTLISGQKPVVTRAKKSIAGFKLREGMPIGCKVTLRGERMYHFLDKLINIALPRVRDFRGVSPKSFDGRGNYTLGLKEQLVFPEIDYDKVDKVRGMDIIIVTTAKTDEEARELLAQMGMPFRKQ